MKGQARLSQERTLKSLSRQHQYEANNDILLLTCFNRHKLRALPEQAKEIDELTRKGQGLRRKSAFDYTDGK